MLKKQSIFYCPPFFIKKSQSHLMEGTSAYRKARSTWEGMSQSGPHAASSAAGGGTPETSPTQKYLPWHRGFGVCLKNYVSARPSATHAPIKIASTDKWLFHQVISPGQFPPLCTHQVCLSPAVVPYRWHMMLLNRRTGSQRGLLDCSSYKGEQNLP